MPTPSSSESRTKIFLSFSKERGKEYAKVFKNWFESFAKNRTFFSADDIEKGSEWRPQVFDKLLQSKALVAFITRESVETARWVEGEAAAVYLGAKDTCVFPILMDLERSELSERSAWNVLFPELSFISPDVDGIEGLMKDIGKACGITSLAKPADRDYLRSQIETLIDKWKTLKAKHAREDRTRPGGLSVLKSFKGCEETFAEWAYQYHRIIHGARDLSVLIQHHGRRLDDPNEALKVSLRKATTQGEEPDEHPMLVLFKPMLQQLLDRVQFVFQELLNDSGAKVWVCLRDLRKDHNDKLAYYTFARSRPPSERHHSTPWPANGVTVTELQKTVSKEVRKTPKGKGKTNGQFAGRDCTILANPGDKHWPKASRVVDDRDRQQSILGAVILKKVTKVDKEPDQGMLWWILCLNSDKPAVFGEAHRRLLQGCNDAFSAVANAMIHAYQPGRATKK